MLFYCTEVRPEDEHRADLALVDEQEPELAVDGVSPDLYRSYYEQGVGQELHRLSPLASF